MSAPGSEDTALGTARGRFVASLPRKAVELRGAIALLTSTPAAIAPRDEMRRRLQTLYASALVFRDRGLAELVKGGIDRIDVAQEQGRGLTLYDLQVLAGIVAKLPTLHRAERGAAVLAAALRDEPPLDMSEAEEAALHEALDAQLPEVTRPDLPGPDEASGESFTAYRSPGRPAGPAPSAGVPIAGVQVVTAAVAKHPQIREEYAPRVKETLSGLSPVPEDGEDLPERPTVVARVSQAPLHERPTVISYADKPPGQPASATALPSEPATEGYLRLDSSPVRDASPVRAPSRAPLLQRVVRVLLLETGEHAAQLRAHLPRASFEVAVAESPDDALRMARSEGPDVVVASRALASEADFIRRLRSDPLTDFVPVVLVQSGADALDPVAARELGADEVLSRPVPPSLLTECIGRVTGTLVDEAHALAALPDATLSEVAERVAEEIRHGLVEAAESGRDLRVPLGGGAEVLAAAWSAVARVRAFVSQQSGGRIRFRDLPTRGGPAVLALVGGHVEERAGAETGSLTGRCVLVVDDDPSVVWFFAGLLREAGATVLEAQDGREALEMARGRRPDVVISDILMPELDGFALCRALQRDPLLADVPVILLSWKEDLLHRMRELQVGASGYLRKEAAAGQILQRVREVLRTRAQLEASLTAGGEVRGSLEGIGLVPMLRSVGRSRPDSRVTIRDAWNVFEAELRRGQLRGLTRTASDGTLSRGEAALPQLLGTSSGRFTVTDSGLHQLPHNVEGDLDDALARGARRLGSVMDAVSGAGLMRAQHVRFDADAFSLVQKQSPGPVRELVERLHAGEAPSEVLRTGETSAHTLEAVLLDLARRGAIAGVTDAEGNDLIAAALAARGEPAHALEDEPTGRHSSLPPAPDPAPDPLGLSEPFEGPNPFEDWALAEAPERRAEVPEREPDVPGTASEQSAVASQRPEPAGGPPVQATAARAGRAQASAAPADEPLPPILREGSVFTWRWVAALVVLAAIGYFGARALRRSEPRVSALSERAADERLDALVEQQAAPIVEPEPPPEKDAVPAPDLEPLARAEGPLVPEDVGFRIYAGITDTTVEVGDDEGLLIVGARSGAASSVRIDGKAAGELPIKRALPAGIHELELQRGDTLEYLFVSISSGKTWVLAKP